MKKKLNYFIIVCMAFNFLLTPSTFASTKKKENLNELTSKQTILSMKNASLNYKSITLDSLNKDIYNDFGKPDKKVINKNKFIVTTQNIYTTKNNNKYTLYTNHDVGSEKYDRLRYVVIDIYNKNLKLSDMDKRIQKPYKIKKYKNYSEYLVSDYLTLHVKKINNHNYVTSIYYASLSSLPE